MIYEATGLGLRQLLDPCGVSRQIPPGAVLVSWLSLGFGQGRRQALNHGWTWFAATRLRPLALPSHVAACIFFFPAVTLASAEFTEVHG